MLRLIIDSLLSSSLSYVGAGKTTLLNVIAGYGSGGRTEGDILVNGEKVDSSFMRELSGSGRKTFN